MRFGLESIGWLHCRQGVGIAQEGAARRRSGRILLRKVGGGYLFPHITFCDYFAALTPECIDALARRSEARKAGR